MELVYMYATVGLFVVMAVSFIIVYTIAFVYDLHKMVDNESKFTYNKDNKLGFYFKD